MDTLVTENGVATSKLLYLGDYIVMETIAPEGYILDTTPYQAALLYDGQVATVKRMAAAGPVLEVGQGEKPGTAVPDTDNNASLTIPNQPIPPSPKTGDPLPLAALTACAGSLLACGVFLAARKRKRR